MSGFTRLVIVVPTRNRAALARIAVQSALDAGLQGVRVLVSDNSTDPEDLKRLATTCMGLGVDRVRPPRPLPMADHWEWALDRAFDDIGASHVTVLTDRMAFQPGALGAVLDIVRCHPDEVISYAHDRLDDRAQPVCLEQLPWSGRALQIPTAVSVAMIARSDQSANMAMPRLLNSVAPRSVVHQIRHRFGAACGNAIAPDYAFAFRCLAVLEMVVYYDRPALLHYALDRSNGASAADGRVSVDHADFLANLDRRGVNYAAPIPGLDTVFSTIMHEYSAVRDQGVEWPVVDWDRYLDVVTAETTLMQDGDIKRETLASLAMHRRGREPVRALGTSGSLRRIRRFTRSALQAYRRLRRAVHPDPSDVAPRLTTWETRDEALAYARDTPRQPHPGISGLELAIGPVLRRVPVRVLVPSDLTDCQ